MLARVSSLAVIGAGSFLVTLQVTDDGKPEAKNVAAQALSTPMAEFGASIAAASPDASREDSAPPAKSTALAESTSPSASAEEKAVAEEIAAARAAAAKDGVKLQRPLPPPQGDAAAAKVVNTGSLRRDRATMRVVSARGDLTGQRELAMVAGKGTPVGDAFCSQMIRVSAGAKPVKKPNLLLCWRTSAQKSVITVAVDLDGDPSEDRSVAAINKEWQALG